MLHGAAQTEPGSERDAARGAHRSIAQIQRHHAEAAALQQQVRRTERMCGVVAAADPQQPRQLHAGSGGGERIERILGIHQGAEFLACGGSSQNRNQQAGAAGRRRAENLREAPARQPAGRQVDFRNAARNRFSSRFRLPPEVTAEQRFELFPEQRRAHDFAFCSPT